MRKKFLGIVVVVMVVIAAGYNIYMIKRGMNLSNMVLNNVEALADYGETTPYDCYMGHCCYDPAYDCFGSSDRWHYCPNMRSY